MVADKKILTAQEEPCGSHGSFYAVGFFWSATILCSLKPPFCLGLLDKRCQTSDVLITFLYIPAKSKRIETVPLTIKQEILNLEELQNCISGSKVMAKAKWWRQSVEGLLSWGPSPFSLLNGLFFMKFLRNSLTNSIW